MSELLTAIEELRLHIHDDTTFAMPDLENLLAEIDALTPPATTAVREAIVFLGWVATSYDTHAKMPDMHPEEVDAYAGSAEMARDHVKALSALIGIPGAEKGEAEPEGREVTRYMDEHNVGLYDARQALAHAPPAPTSERVQALELLREALQAEWDEIQKLPLATGDRHEWDLARRARIRDALNHKSS